MEDAKETVTDLRIRALQARKALRDLGLERGYTALMRLQAAKESRVLTKQQCVRCRQLLNGNLTLADRDLLELAERAVRAQQKIYGRKKEQRK